MIKILCLLQTAKFNVKNMAFLLIHDLKGIDEEGWSHPTYRARIHELSWVLSKNCGRTQVNARGSTRNVTSLIDKDLFSIVR